MQKKHLKKVNAFPSKTKLNIPQPKKINSVNKKININLINNANFYFNQHNSHLDSIFNRKSKIYKDSLDENISESKTNILIPDSLNNTKRSIKENTNRNNNLNKEESDKNINEEETKKIDYRYYTNYPLKDYLNNNYNNFNIEEKKRNKIFWIATYDKMMKKQKLIKILNYYSKNKKYEENDIKEKLIQIKDFEIFFPNQSHNPFIYYNQKGIIFTKLYLLNLENINILLSYMNRIKINIKENELDKLIIKGDYKIISENNNFKYNIIYFMGTFLNINIYGFSNICNDEDNNKYKNNSLSIDDNQKTPSSKKVAKLVKLLMSNFPKYNSDYFINYLLSKKNLSNYLQKLNEIKSFIFCKNTDEMHHKIVNSNCLAEVAAFTSSLTATSMMTPYSFTKDDFFNNKINNNTSKKIEVINKTVESKENIGKYPTYINNNIKLDEKDKKSKILQKKSTEKKIMKVLSTKKISLKANKNFKMNYIKISLKKNVSKYHKNDLNIIEKKIKDNKRSLLSTANKKNNSKQIKSKSNIKKNERNLKNIKNIKINNTSFNKSYNNKLNYDISNFLPKFSLINTNINSNKISISNLINNRKKKWINKPSICYDKIKAQNFFYNTEIQQKSFDKLKSNINHGKSQNNNKLLDSLDLNKYLEKRKINEKSLDKNKIKREKSKNRGIFVVDRRIKTDIEDDDSSLI